MAGTSIAGLQDHLKLAREYAVEGLYDTPVIFFDGAVAQINKCRQRCSWPFHCKGDCNNPNEDPVGENSKHLSAVPVLFPFNKYDATTNNSDETRTAKGADCTKS